MKTLPKHTELEARIKGTTVDGKPYDVIRKFSLYLRKDGNDYGTSLGMTIERPECQDWQDIDVRYERTTDLKTLVSRYIEANMNKPKEIVFS